MIIRVQRKTRSTITFWLLASRLKCIFVRQIIGKLLFQLQTNVHAFVVVEDRADATQRSALS